MCRIGPAVIATILLAGLAACGGGADEVPMETADTVLLHGRIHTLDPAVPDGAAVAILGDRILRVGSDAEIQAHVGPRTRKIDLHGRSVLPGLIDAHLHLAGFGRRMEELDLGDTTSAEEIAARVAEAASRAPAGSWILGRGWDQNRWATKEFPTTALLDPAAGEHPVALRRVDGHALWVNQAALDAAGVSRVISDPAGGRLLRDHGGKPTGILIDNAMELVEKKIPAPTPETKERWIRRASERLLSMGITSVQDAGVGPDQIELYRRMVEADTLPIRVYAMLGGTDARIADYFAIPPVIGYGDRRFTFRTLKLAIDGALGSRGAALLAPYQDDPKNWGLITHSPESIEQVSREALDKGFQVCVHAIGDRGNRTVLDIFERALAAHPPGDYRFRIEHAQILSPGDIPRFGRVGIIASMQPIHATSDMPWVPARIGEERLAGAYAWRSLLDSSARLAFGSDAPVESPNPFKGMFAAVTRQDEKLQPEGGWLPDQRLTREEALRGFTLDAAYAAFEEKEKGTISPGKLADLIVLDRDYFEVPEAEIGALAPEMTLLGGKTVYQRAPEPGS